MRRALLCTSCKAPHPIRAWWEDREPRRPLSEAESGIVGSTNEDGPRLVTGGLTATTVRES
jgi:hypothetical protein